MEDDTKQMEKATPLGNYAGRVYGDNVTVLRLRA